MRPGKSRCAHPNEVSPPPGQAPNNVWKNRYSSPGLGVSTPPWLLRWSARRWRQRAVASAQRCGISASTSRRARVSSPRLVSWVAVADRPWGALSARSRLRRWNSSTDIPDARGVTAHLGQGGQGEIPVEGGVLEALGHHRAGELLEPQHEFAAFGPPSLAGGVGLGGFQQQHPAHEIEQRLVHHRVAPPGAADGDVDGVTVAFADAGVPGPDVGAVDRKAGDHLPSASSSLLRVKSRV